MTRRCLKNINKLRYVSGDRGFDGAPGPKGFAGPCFPGLPGRTGDQGQTGVIGFTGRHPVGTGFGITPVKLTGVLSHRGPGFKGC